MTRIYLKLNNFNIFFRENLNFNRYSQLYNGIFRCQHFGSTKNNLDQNSGNDEEITNPPRSSHSNWIAPPHPVSNLRLIRFFIPKNELKAVKEYRERVEEVQMWNQMYWEKHNREYLKLKEEFTKVKLEEIRLIEKDRQTLTASEMAVFYKKFLNDNHKKHMKYNRDWYMKNIGLLWWALRANSAKWYHRLKFRKKNFT